MDSEFIMVICNCPDTQTAEQIAGELVRLKLAACVNILPGITSVYRWQNKITTDSEVQLQIKTTGALYNRLAQKITALHPYEIAEIIAVPIAGGNPGYLQWLRESSQT